MALPDLTVLTDEELLTVQVLAAQRLRAREQAAADEEQALRSTIAGAVDTLANLLGPIGATKPTMENLLAGRVSIREVGAFSPAELATQPGLALSLILKGLESVVATQIAQAQVQSRAL